MKFRHYRDSIIPLKKRKIAMKNGKGNKRTFALHGVRWQLVLNQTTPHETSHWFSVTILC